MINYFYLFLPTFVSEIKYLKFNQLIYIRKLVFFIMWVLNNDIVVISKILFKDKVE